MNKTGITYRPEIQIRYEVGGRHYKIWTYDAVMTFSSDEAGHQAIIDRFQIGAKYSCWYDPDSPGKAVLVRGYTWFPYAILVVPLAALGLGGGGMYVAWKHRNKPAEHLAQ